MHADISVVTIETLTTSITLTSLHRHLRTTDHDFVLRQSFGAAATSDLGPIYIYTYIYIYVHIILYIYIYIYYYNINISVLNIYSVHIYSILIAGAFTTASAPARHAMWRHVVPEGRVDYTFTKHDFRKTLEFQN